MPFSRSLNVVALLTYLRQSAGVIGLTTALVLAKDAGFQVTILAQHLPGDKHPTYASPWAGANYLP
jgi:D-amino-acid oxidase